MLVTRFRLRPSEALRFSGDGTCLATLGRRVMLWDVAKRRKVASALFADAASVDFSPDGRLLAVKNTAGDVLVLGVPDLDVVAQLSGRESGEGAPVRFTADGQYIVDASRSGVLMLRDPVGGSTAWLEAGAAQRRPGCHPVFVVLRPVIGGPRQPLTWP